AYFVVGIVVIAKAEPVRDPPVSANIAEGVGAGKAPRHRSRLRLYPAGLLPRPIARPACGGHGSASWARRIAASRARISGAMAAARRVARLTCNDSSSLVAASQPSSAWYIAWK